MFNEYAKLKNRLIELDKRFTDVICSEEGIIFYDNGVYRSFNEEGFEEWLNKEDEYRKLVNNIIISEYNRLSKELDYWAEKEDMQAYGATKLERGIVVTIAEKLGIDL